MEARDGYMLRSRIGGSYNEIIVVRNADTIIADQAILGELPEEFVVYIYDMKSDCGFSWSNSGKADNNTSGAGWRFIFHTK